MYWQSREGKQLLIGLAAVLLMLLIAIPVLSNEITISRQPVQEAQVTVVAKRTSDHYTRNIVSYKKSKIPNCFVTFKFPDGSEKELKIKHAIFENLQEGDTGTLSYKERKNATHFDHRRFVGFEKE